jgi:PqqD family protein of HPr-rel-A system
MTGAWRIVPDAVLHWRMWDDEYVVFNSASGQTHLLDPVSALLIEQIAHGRDHAGELFMETARLLNLDLTPDLCASFDKMLGELDLLGLIEAVAS